MGIPPELYFALFFPLQFPFLLRFLSLYSNELSLFSCISPEKNATHKLLIYFLNKKSRWWY